MCDDPGVAGGRSGRGSGPADRRAGDDEARERAEERTAPYRSPRGLHVFVIRRGGTESWDTLAVASDVR
jgi:hypothetical protein